MKKVVFSTALEFNSHAELVSDCIDCIKNYDLDTGILKKLELSNITTQSTV